MRSTKFIATALLITFNFMLPAEAATQQNRLSKEGIQYMTGGIGDEDASAIRQHARNFTLNLMFSEGLSGQSVAEVNVNIYNEDSKLVFRIKGAKPMLNVNLPAGIYTILASNNGNKLRHKVTIKENTSQKVILNWKDESEETSLRNSDAKE